MSTDTITVEQARDRLRQDYWDDVRAIVQDARDELERGNIDRNEDAIREYLEESVDSSQRVIYTNLILDTLLWCSNHDAYTEEYGPDGITEDGTIKWERLAYAALLADVMDQVRAEGLFDLREEADDTEE